MGVSGRSQGDGWEDGAYADVELVRTKITASIGSLHDHLLARHRPARERKFITSTTPALFASTSNIHSGIPICQVVRNSPGRLVGAHIRSSAITPRDCIGVRERVVVDIAGLNRSRSGSESRLTRPSA